MPTKPKLLRWGLMAGYLGIITSMLACMAVGLGTSNVDSGTLQIDNGSVEVKGVNGEWRPVAGASSFELVGELKNTNPWVVAGTTLETSDQTQIADGLKVGDLVRVKGTVIENNHWVANSIEPANAQTDPSSTIVIVGKVTSTTPWVVNGITLNVTPDTVITGNITPGMLVRVEVLLADDGTWEVLSIAPLGDFTEVDGCVTVAATIVSVSTDQIQFVGWPSLPLRPDVKIQRESGDENSQGDEGQGTTVLQPNQNVLVVLCPSDNNQIVITQIIVIVVNPPDEGGTETPGNNEKVLVCHKPNKNAHTLSLPPSAVPAHLAHGDKLGACP